MYTSRFWNKTWLVPAALAGIFLVALALRLYNLDAYSLWYDEVASVETAQRGLFAIFTDRFGWMLVQPPMHYLLIWLAAQPVDPTVHAYMVRLPSVLAGALTPLITYALGRELFGRAQGILAALIVAFSPVMLDYSQDLRPYSVLAFLTVCAVYCLVMAERTASWKWWAAFVAAMLLNLFNAYVALTLVLPALAPYFLWILWRLRAREKRRELVRAIVAMSVLGLAALGVLLDMMQVPRLSPDLRLLHPGALVLAPVDLATWLGNLGIAGDAGEKAGYALLVLALFQAYIAVRKRGRLRGVLLCGLFLVVPAVILVVMSTTNTVFQRYALFVTPFYALLLGNCAAGVRVTAVNAVEGRKIKSGSGRYIRGLNYGIAGLIVALYGLSALSFSTSDGHNSMSNRPDFRGATTYLAQHVKPGDAIICIGWDPTTYAFYWKGKPPVPVYYIEDPRLWTAPVGGSIYWVVSLNDNSQGQFVAKAGWNQVTAFRQLYVLSEPVDKSGVAANMARMVAFIQGTTTDYPFRERALASMYQAQGDIVKAARAYRSAGTYIPIGGEYLETAQGFEQHGEPAKAWRDALVAKEMEPENASIHEFLSKELQAEGYTDQSRTEALIADMLRGFKGSK